MSEHVYLESLREHYLRTWNGPYSLETGTSRRVREISSFFRVMCVESKSDSLWVFCTVGMSKQTDATPLELHLMAPFYHESLVDLLCMTAHFHRTASSLGLHHTVNFGQSWIHGSSCDYGLISLPYLYGPRLEWHMFEGVKCRCLWLVPITEAEKNYKASNGVDALEEKFEAENFNYLLPSRPSVV